MAKLEHVHTETFPEQVLQAAMPVLVDFTAAWCAPCKMLEPILEELADQWSGKVRIVRVDVDQNPELAMEYRVMGVPTLILFQGGQAIERLSGYQPKERLMRAVQAHLASG